MSDDVRYYASPGSMTEVSGFDPALAGLPTDPIGVAAAVQGLILHPFWVDAYGVKVAQERQDDVQVRPASAMIERILEIAPGPLVESRPPDRRFAGNCRHFSVLTVALLRRAGVPSRARCGFAGYFETGKWVDHWVVEYWDVGRDLAALNKVEMLPWDGWGRLMGESASDRDDAYVDEIAALTVSGEHATIRSRYQHDDELRVPPRVVSFFTGAGPVEVVVAEWV